jgi:hypothetical protein
LLSRVAVAAVEGSLRGGAQVRGGGERAQVRARPVNYLGLSGGTDTFGGPRKKYRRNLGAHFWRPNKTAET